MIGDINPRDIVEINKQLSRIANALERIASAAEGKEAPTIKSKPNTQIPRTPPGR